LNFGLLTSPERHLLFDINDFDETLPKPWEWDVERPAVSLVVAGRAIRFWSTPSARGGYPRPSRTARSQSRVHQKCRRREDRDRLQEP
jgi:hypothetical protein